jgi:hypothetical protein
MGLGLQADLGLQAAWLLNRAVAIFALLRCKSDASRGAARLKKLALHHLRRKHLWIPAELFAQQAPVEARTRILFAARRDVLVAGDVRDRVVLRDRGAQARERLVLRLFEGLAFEAFELDAD